jgi:hypothetical protein
MQVRLALMHGNQSEGYMANEFNPGGPIERDSATRGSQNPPTVRAGDGRHWSTYVILALLAVVIVVGLFLTVRDTNTSASNSAPGTTTGSSVPSPSNPPAVPGPAGQGESNSTR